MDAGSGRRALLIRPFKAALIESTHIMKGD
jgi:hypothetical protein